MKTKFITQTAVIAALYAALTLCLAPIGFGVVQLRVSEALTVLPMFTAAAIPGLTIGCLIANYIGFAFIGGAGVVDIIFGSLATFIAAVCSYKLRKNKWLVPLPPVLCNGIIVGGYLHFLVMPEINIFLCMLSVAVGEIGAAYVFGLLLIKFLEKKNIFKS